MGFKALGAVLLPERGRRVYPICPSQEAALGMDVLIWVSHARKSLEQASRQKGTGSDRGDSHQHSRRESQTLPGAPWMAENQKKIQFELGNNLEMEN